MSAQSFRPGDIVRIRDQSWVVHRHVTGVRGSVLEVRGRSATNRGTRAAFLLPCEPIERLLSSDTPRLVHRRAWQRLARRVLADATPSYEALRSPVHANFALLPFQLEPALAIVRGRASRVLIADEVGLGKTIQAGLIINETTTRFPDARVLVVTPSGLRDQWRTELLAQFGIESSLLDSSAIARHAGEWGVNPWTAHPVVITSLDYVKRPEVVRALEAMVWDVMVFDEAHALAGRSDRATVAAALSQRARTVVLLTATPHSGDEEAFARLALIGDITRQFPLLVFRRTRADIGLASSRRTTTLRVRPTGVEIEMHAALSTYAHLVWKQTTDSAPAARLAMTVLMRRACSSAWSLARSIETRLQLLTAVDSPDLVQMALPFQDRADEDEAPACQLSAAGLTDRVEETRWLTHVLGLARTAALAESKPAALRRFLRRTAEPAIVFTEYRDTLGRIAPALTDHAVVQLHGGLTFRERQDVLARFVSGDVRVLLATDAASEGLNLHQRCRLVINLELPWTPVRLEQRVGRVERLGQSRRVHAVHLLASGTCEEVSVEVLLKRARRAADVLGRMRASSIEQQIARVAVGQEPSSDASPHLPAPLPDGLFIEDLRDCANEEAARLQRARALAAPPWPAPVHPASLTPLGRPVVAVFRRRAKVSRRIWAYRLVFADAEQHAVWETVLGVELDDHEAPSLTVEKPLMTSRSQLLLASLLMSLEPSLSLALRREQAVIEALQARRARVAAMLVQPGLFDRRAERSASAQHATLDEALSRCERRLTELGRLKRIDVEPPRLVFGLVRR